MFMYNVLCLAVVSTSLTHTTQCSVHSAHCIKFHYHKRLHIAAAIQHHSVFITSSPASQTRNVETWWILCYSSNISIDSSRGTWSILSYLSLVSTDKECGGLINPLLFVSCFNRQGVRGLGQSPVRFRRLGGPSGRQQGEVQVPRGGWLGS